MIRYEKLFRYLKDHDYQKTDLLDIISSGTLAKLGKNESIKVEIIDKICLFLNCQPGDIMECVRDDEYITVTGEDGKKYRLQKIAGRNDEKTGQRYVMIDEEGNAYNGL